MKREIKLRAWDGERMHYPEDNKIEYANSVLSSPRISGRREKECETHVMQYTGLKDKNNVDIYEGDFLKTSVGILTVNWHTNFASFCIDKEGWMFSHFFKEALDPSECEIIGNIHENPELL